MDEQKYSLQEIAQMLDEMGKNRDRFPTGIRDLDALTGGLCKGGLTVLGSRPGMGSSALVFYMVSRLLAKVEGTIAIFSPMSRKIVFAQLLQTGLGVEVEKLLTDRMPAQEATQACKAFFESRKSNIQIFDASIMDMENILWYCHMFSDLALVIVDGIEHICEMPDVPDDGKVYSPVQMPKAQIFQELKLLAQKMNVPVLCTAHLHRSLEKRKNKRPRLNDLKKIDITEEMADQILFLYRDSYYDFCETDGSNGYPAECIVAKNSYGATGTARLRWHPHMWTYTDL